MIQVIWQNFKYKVLSNLKKDRKNEVLLKVKPIRKSEETKGQKFDKYV